MTIWRQIPNFDNYMITNEGKVYNIKRGIEMKLSKHKQGYSCVVLSKNNHQTLLLIHRVLAELFIPNPENKQYVDHKNQDKSDNSLSNLRWVTKRENAINIRLRSNNTSEVTGVNYDKNSKMWRGYFRLNGKHISQYFNTKKDAISYRLEMQNKYYTDFNSQI